MGFVGDAELLQLYNACDVFVFPSFYEGFGLPALEAMACGRAVVCSDASALPEVVDGAAILFDPYAVDEMVRAIADILVDGELRARWSGWGCSARRISAGRRRLQDFGSIPRSNGAGSAAQPARGGSQYCPPLGFPISISLLYLRLRKLIGNPLSPR